MRCYLDVWSEHGLLCYIMSLGTKNRLAQTASRCREYLRETHHDQLELVNEFISDMEGDDRDVGAWSKLADLKRSDKELIQRVEDQFQQWLNP